MDTEYIGQLAQRSMERGQKESVENAGHDQIALAAMGVAEEAVDSLMTYMLSAIHQQMFEMMVSGDIEGSMSPSEVIKVAISAAVPTTLLVSRQLYIEQGGQQVDQYMATVGAEIALKNWIMEGKLLSEIWPQEYVQEITSTFDNDPAKSFLAGVMCGRNDG